MSNGTIYRDGKPYAEIKYFRPAKSNDIYRGIAVHYLKTQQNVWVFPEKGYTLLDRKTNKDITDIDIVLEVGDKARNYILKVNGRYLSKGQLVNYRCYDANITEDGYLTYKTKGIAWDSTHKYKLEDK